MGTTIPERVSQIYYTYGLFCSSYPITAITFAISIVLLCCFPLLNVPLPGNIPTVINIPLSNNFGTNDDTPTKYVSKIQESTNQTCHPEDILTTFNQIVLNETKKLPYIWANNKPMLYVHQIILKTGVSPWNRNLRMLDAFRTPIQEVFRLLETIRNHEDPETKTTLVRHCFHIDNIKRRDSRASKERVLPEYSCLILSPANLWQQNLQTFSQDANLVNTILKYQNLHKGKTSIAEMAFGMPLREAGIKRYPLRSRPRVLQYAVTIFYTEVEERFIISLSRKLKEMYPLHQDLLRSVQQEAQLIYYPGEFNYRELVPLTVIFFGVFLYVYYSVRKIEFIKSKLGLATSAVLTIAGSLSMCMGLCFSFGFSLSLQGKEIFPYLVVIIGLENVLVLTKSVISTDSRLDVKIRLAQGLSKEGWSITKNLLVEITIFTVSLFTFVPFIQEFSIFMIICHISDYFMQMTFYATILGINMRRMEYFQDKNNKLHLKDYFNSNSTINWTADNIKEETDYSPQRITKSISHPRLNGTTQLNPTDVVAKRRNSPVHTDSKVPKRIKLVHLWAQTRVFQRAFMIWMIVWISNIVYNSGIVDYFIYNVERNEPSADTNKNSEHKEYKLPDFQIFNTNANSSTHVNTFSSLVAVTYPESSNIHENETIGLKHGSHHHPWSRLSPHFWSAILSQYNESFSGDYIVVLPPLLLSCRISPEMALSAQNPEERDPPKLRWEALAAALDPIDIMPDFEGIDGKPQTWGISKSATELPIYPTTPMEILLLAILCTISVLVIAYMMVVFYRCVCSRNYAEWRASWNENEDYLKIIAKQPAVQLVMEAVPLVVSGHNHEVECLVSDGEKIVSSCLQGTIKVWDSQNGDLLTEIDRYEYFNKQSNFEVHQPKPSMKTSKSEQELKSDLVPTSCSYISNGDKNKKEVTHTLRRRLVDHVSDIQHDSDKISSFNTDRMHWQAAKKAEYYFAKSFSNHYSMGQPKYRKDSAIEDCKQNENFDNEVNKREHDKNDLNLKLDNINFNDISVTDSSTDNTIHNEQKTELSKSSGSIESDTDMPNRNWRERDIPESPIWCMDFCSGLIVLGCADGRLEFWEATSGKLLCVWWSSTERNSYSGVTHVRVLAAARRFCIASLSGQLTLVRLNAYNAAAGVSVDWNFSTAHRRTHKRTGSAGSISSYHKHQDDSTFSYNRLDRQSFSYNTQEEVSYEEEVHCSRVAHCRAHQQPITEMHTQSNRILTGGQDHILKVFLNSDLTPLFTLHGHCGPITSCFIDHANPTIGGSGSQDGLLCVWDLYTGACLYSTQAHDGAVTSLAYTASYVISCGSDERLCIWDRFQGHMLNSIHIGLNYMSRMLPLTHTMLLIGDRSGLTVYDLSSGEIIRRVLLGQNDGCVFVRQIVPLRDAVVCDYSNQLRIVRFPLVSKL